MHNSSEDEEKHLYIGRFHSILRFLWLLALPGNPPFGLPDVAHIRRHPSRSKRSSKSSDHRDLAILLALKSSEVAVTSITKPSHVALIATASVSGSLPAEGKTPDSPTLADVELGTSQGDADVTRNHQSNYGSDSNLSDPLALVVFRNVSSSVDSDSETQPGSPPYTSSSIYDREFASNPQHRDSTLKAHGDLLVTYLNGLGESFNSAPGGELSEHNNRMMCVYVYVANVMTPKISECLLAPKRTMIYMEKFRTRKIREGAVACESFFKDEREAFVTLWKQINSNVALAKRILENENRPLDRDLLHGLAEQIEMVVLTKSDTTEPKIFIVSFADFYEVVKFTLLCYEQAVAHMSGLKKGSTAHYPSLIVVNAGNLLKALVYSDAMRLLIQNLDDEPVTATSMAYGGGRNSAVETPDEETSAMEELKRSNCLEGTEISSSLLEALAASTENARPTFDSDIPLPSDLTPPQEKMLEWLRSLVGPFASLNRITRTKLLRQTPKLTLEWVSHTPPSRSLAPPHDILKALYPGSAMQDRIIGYFAKRHREVTADWRWWAFLPQEALRELKRNHGQPSKSEWAHAQSWGSVHCEAILASLPFREAAMAILAKNRMAIGTSNPSCPCCAALVSFLAPGGWVDGPLSYHEGIFECSLPTELPLDIHKEMVAHFADHLRKVLERLVEDPLPTSPRCSSSDSDDETHNTTMRALWMLTG